MSTIYGKFFMKDSNGDIVQLVPDATTIQGEYQGATENANGITGSVPPATSETRILFLRGDGQWADPSSLITPITNAQILSLYE